MRPFLIAVCLLLSVCVRGTADAAYDGKVRMIQKADVIAVVRILRTQKKEFSPESGYSYYGQQATAVVERALKGAPPQRLILLGDEHFICARCHWEKGRYLVFLKSQGKDWRGANWELSRRKITGSQVQWAKEDFAFEFKPTPLGEVTREIQEVLWREKM